jgi:hypothetical protein
MSFLVNPFLLNQFAIVSVENPVMITVHNGTAFGSIVFQSTIKAKLANGFYRQIPVSYASGSYDGNTNAFYTLTGTLSPTGTTVNPLNLTVSIIVWVLPAPTFHFDYVDKNYITGSIDNLSRIVTGVTAKSGGTNPTQIDATLLRRPSWNGEGTFVNTQSGMKVGSVSTFNALHNGTQFTQYYIWKQLAIPNTHRAPVFSSDDGSSAGRGTSLFVDNRISVPRTNALVFTITKGTSGQAPIAIVSSDNAIAQDAWIAAKITYDGTTVRLYTSINGAAFNEVGSATPAFSFSASNASAIMSHGNIVTAGTQTGLRGYLKQMYIQTSLMSSVDIAYMDSWAQAMCTEGLIVDDANIYIRCGQSNQAGRGANSSINAQLNGKVGSRIMVPKPTPPTQTDGTGAVTSDSYWEELELTRNQTIENVATQHGMEMRFGYNFWQHNENCWIVKLGVGGTPIYSTGTYNDWNVSSAQLYTQLYNLTVNALDEAVHVFRKNPVIRGMSIMQGETDAIIAGADLVFKSNWTTFINTFISAIETYGYPISKLRIWFWQISDAGGYAYDATRLANIKAAQADLGTNYLTDNPSMVGKIRGVTYRTTDDIAFLDPQHYNADGLAVMAVHEFEYFKIWASE